MNRLVIVRCAASAQGRMSRVHWTKMIAARTIACGTLVFLSALLLTGCERSAYDVVRGWKDLGLTLPLDQDVTFIESRLPGSLKALRRGLTHSDVKVRCGTASVIERLGEKVRALSQDMQVAFGEEQAWNVRLYLTEGFIAIEDRSPATLTFLASAFESEPHEAVRTSLAGAIVRFGNEDKAGTAWQWLLEHVEPGNPSADVSEWAFRQHWAVRRAAAIAIGTAQHRTAETDAAVQRLCEHPDTPPWVRQQVEDAIREQTE